jgi:hypothetical protein
VQEVWSGPCAVALNPSWGEGVPREYEAVVRSFEVAYSFMPVAIKVRAAGPRACRCCARVARAAFAELRDAASGSGARAHAVGCLLYDFSYCRQPPELSGVRVARPGNLARAPLSATWACSFPQRRRPRATAVRPNPTPRLAGAGGRAGGCCAAADCQGRVAGGRALADLDSAAGRPVPAGLSARGSGATGAAPLPPQNGAALSRCEPL